MNKNNDKISLKTHKEEFKKALPELLMHKRFMAINISITTDQGNNPKCTTESVDFPILEADNLNQ